VRKADNLPPSCAVVTSSGSLNFREPCGPVQASNGTDLPFTHKVLVRRDKGKRADESQVACAGRYYENGELCKDL